MKFDITIEDVVYKVELRCTPHIDELSIKINDVIFRPSQKERIYLYEIMWEVEGFVRENKEYDNNIEKGITQELKKNETFMVWLKQVVKDRVEPLLDDDFFKNIETITSINNLTEENFATKLELSIKEYQKAKQANQTLLTQQTQSVIVKIFVNKILNEIMPNTGYITFGQLEDLQKRLKIANKQEIFVKEIEDFPFTIPTIVDKITKEAVFQKKIGKEYYNPYEIYMRAKNTGLFLDFLVVHYDKRSDEVKQDEAKAKDPIIFGILKGTSESGRIVRIPNSAILIPITDWKDKYCNLTIEEFINKGEQNNIDISSLKDTNKPLNILELTKQASQEIDKKLQKDLKNILEQNNIQVPQNIFEKSYKIFKKILTKKQPTRVKNIFSL